MTTLKTLKSHQDLILLAEIGVLIHDLGKLSAEFVRAKATDGQGDDIHHLFLRRYPPQVPGFLVGYSGKLNRVKTALRYLDSVGTDQARALHAYLEAEYKANPGLDLGGALRAYVKKNPGAYELIDQVEKVAKEHKKFSSELTLAKRVAQIPDDFLPGTLLTLLNSLTLPACPSSKKEPLLSETVIGELIEGHHSPPAPRRVRKSEYLTMLRARDDGVDGFDSWVDKGRFPKGPKDEPFKQLFAQTYIATAFGHEAQKLPVGPDEDGLKDVRYQFTEVLADALNQVRDGKAKPAQVRACIFKAAETAFRQALGETRRAANDVTLWDHCYSTASLYKAALAKVLLEKALDEEYEFPLPATIGWRFLWVGVDGMSFFAQAHHVTDILGRQRVLTDALDRVRQALEVDYPLGNEVYRDENGSVFVMPGLDGEDAHKELAHEVEELVLEIFRQMGVGGELVPHLAWNDEGAVRRLRDNMPDMMEAFSKLVSQAAGPASADPKAMDGWWRDVQSAGKEICTVCGQRPVGYIEPGLEMWVKPQKAKDRNVCGVCLHRRGRRAHEWARNRKAQDEKIGLFERTIWIDEVADNNGRFALVVGRFALDDWLDGKLVRTMLVAPGKEKNPSPARIRRCWDTTRQFWLEVQNEVILDKVGERLRLGIRPTNAPVIRKTLGRWHTYEAEVGGRRLGLCWDPNDKDADDRDLFWSTANLDYLAAQIGTTVDKLKGHIRGRILPLYEPGGYLGQDSRANVDAERCQVVYEEVFHPFIPLMIEPATFMALVPADRALDVTRAIRDKYDQEMARVRDRLPLHLGLIFAPRRTPMSAVLEAGRAMLKMPDGWEKWEVETTDRQVRFSRNGQKFEWTYPAKMGDGQTDDIWYPNLLTPRPEAAPPEEWEFQISHASDEKMWVRPCYVERVTGTVFIRPSRFDFEFLDTTARRFEIRYDDDGRRPHRTRPFLLDDLGRLETLWAEMCQLKKSQRYQVISAIETAREDWFGTDSDCRSWADDVFRRFVRDTLAGAAWPKECPWKAICNDKKDKQLEDAGVAGELADLAELHMEILKE